MPTLSVADIKPRSTEDLENLLRSLYFSFCQVNPNRNDEMYRAGYIAGLAATALQVGINPAVFLSTEDVLLLRRARQ